MDPRFKAKYEHVVGLYPAMSPEQRMLEAAKLLSQELGPFWEVLNDGTVRKNRSWHRDLDRYERYVYDEIEKEFGNGSRRLNEMAKGAVDTYRQIRDNKLPNPSREEYDSKLRSVTWELWLAEEVVRVVSAKLRKRIRQETSVFDTPGWLHDIHQNALPPEVRVEKLKPDAQPSSGQKGSNHYSKGGTFDIEFDVEALETLRRMFEGESMAEKLRRSAATSEVEFVRRYFKKTWSHVAEYEQEELHEDGTVVYQSLSAAFDLATQQKQTIVVWLREKHGLTRWRVAPNNVASEVKQ